MRESRGLARRRAVGVTLAFWCYAAALFLIVRSLSHAYFGGWFARVITMAGMALGLSLWGRWLQPRIVWCLGAIAFGLFVLCYVTVLAPFALAAKWTQAASRPQGGSGRSSWMLRRPTLQTLDDARQEF